MTDWTVLVLHKEEKTARSRIGWREEFSLEHSNYITLPVR